MAVTIYIPTPFRRLTDNQARVVAEGTTIGALLDDLERRYPGIRARVADETGEIHHFVNVYVNDQEAEGRETPLSPGDEVAIIPALAGGAVPFSPEQITRYSRHIMLTEVGGTGQRRLLNGKVLCVGAGGLGSPTALYLAAAGVGTIGIIDGDVVDLSNLQRQVLHDTDDVGRPKVDSATERLNAINPGVKIVPYQTVLTSENALEITREYDVVVNGCDNFPTRYLVNDACVFLGKPLVDSSILRFEGMAAVFAPGQGCYRCLFPAPPPPGVVPSCAEAGVIGALCGIMGSIQALEAVKLLIGIGKPLAGRLLLFDGLDLEFREVKLRRDPKCPVCGDNPTITELIDYNEFCGVPGVAQHV